jgi:hypothetical protein
VKPKRITVNVTAHDIANGRKKDCYKCPVALALMRALEAVNDIKVKTVSVGNGAAQITLVYSDHMSTYSWPQLPDAAADFVWRFDNFRVVEPFSFELEIP